MYYESQAKGRPGKLTERSIRFKKLKQRSMADHRMRTQA